MTQPVVSILLPHLRNPSNDEALRVCLDCLIANTTLDYHLDMEAVEQRRDIYAVINRMARRAPTDWIIPLNTDVFVSPNWIDSLWDARQSNTIVSPVMVECGAIPVNDLNLERNFGRTPSAFDRAGFEAWVAEGGGWRDDWRDGDQAWFFPSLIEREAFLALGGFDLTKGVFPAPLDIDFWNRWEAGGGRFKRVHSFVYHLQVFSDPTRGVRT